MNKAYELAEKIIADCEKHAVEYTSDEGKFIVSEDAITSLNSIIEEGFTLYKYLIEKDLLKDIPEAIVAAKEIQKYIDKLTINKKNAKKLHLSNVLQIWNQAKLAIAVLACAVLDHRDKTKENT